MVQHRVAIVIRDAVICTLRCEYASRRDLETVTNAYLSVPRDSSYLSIIVSLPVHEHLPLPADLHSILWTHLGRS